MKQKSFTKGIHFYKLVWIFVIGSFLGVCYESVLTFCTTGTWVSRQGMLYGPFNQIYGIGAVLFMMILFRMKSSWAIFFTSALIGGVFEYVASVLQEFFFHSTSWNYSSHFLNIQGRTSVPVMIGWGLLGLFFIKVLAPYFNRWINCIPKVPGKLITWAVILFFCLNLSLTGLAVAREQERKKGLAPGNQLEVWLDQTYPDDYLNRVFPNKKGA